MLKIQQEKFCADGKQVEGSEKQLWLVPVSVTTASSPDKAVHRFVLDQHEVAISLENINPSDWVKVSYLLLRKIASLSYVIKINCLVQCIV